MIYDILNLLRVLIFDCYDSCKSYKNLKKYSYARNEGSLTKKMVILWECECKKGLEKHKLFNVIFRTDA